MNRIFFILFSSILIFLSLETVSYAANFSFALDDSVDTTSRIIQIIGLITVLSLAPSILVMVTSFTRIVIIFSFLKSALGLQQSPPNMVMVSLALFLTYFIMAPTFEKSYEMGISPLLNEQISEQNALPRIALPFKEFMLKHVRKSDLDLFISIAKEKADNIDNVSYKTLIPAFMISELRRAFEIGFLIFMPFLVIDILIASILMAMGMMMVPPAMISLPFKIIFFVIVDGWYMICGSIVKSYMS